MIRVTDERPATSEPAHGSRPDARAELLAVALGLFARDGYTATSIAAIAEAAGYSKSSVLYHFATKEQILADGLAPVVARLEALITGAVTDAYGPSSEAGARDLFLESFVDFLLEYRAAASIFLNQGQSLRGIPIIDEANSVLVAFATGVVQDQLPTVEQRVRLGVALGGAAYSLAALSNWTDIREPDVEVKAALVAVLRDCLAPASGTGSDTPTARA